MFVFGLCLGCAVLCSWLVGLLYFVAVLLLLVVILVRFVVLCFVVDLLVVVGWLRVRVCVCVFACFRFMWLVAGLVVVWCVVCCLCGVVCVVVLCFGLVCFGCVDCVCGCWCAGRLVLFLLLCLFVLLFMRLLFWFCGVGFMFVFSLCLIV